MYCRGTIVVYGFSFLKDDALFISYIFFYFWLYVCLNWYLHVKHVSLLDFDRVFLLKSLAVLTLEVSTPENGHTQTIRRQQPTNCLSVFDHFVTLALKGLNQYLFLQKATSMIGS